MVGWEDRREKESRLSHSPGRASTPSLPQLSEIFFFILIHLDAPS